MPINWSGPHIIEFNLSGWQDPLRNHTLAFNCAIIGSPAAGTPATGMSVQQKGGSAGNLQTRIQEMWNFLRLSYPATITVGAIDIWKTVPNSEQRIYLTSTTVTTPTGNAGSYQPARQATMTFRCGAGGVLKVVILEGNQSGDSRVPLVPNGAGNQSQQFAAWALSASSIILGDDDSFPIAAMNLSLCQNGHWRKKLFRGQ